MRLHIEIHRERAYAADKLSLGDSRVTVLVL